MTTATASILPPRSTSLVKHVRRRAMRAGIPLSATLELTAQCNLRCAHCYIVNPVRKDELVTGEWKAVLDQLAAAGTLMLTLTGGEPLLRTDFFELARYARLKEFSFVLFTNGTLIDAAMADRLQQLHPQRVEMSLLGGTAATHDGITGSSGSFDRTLNAAHHLTERGITVQLKATWMRDNIAETDQLAAIARDCGAYLRTGFLLLDHRDPHIRTTALLPTDEQLETLAKRQRAEQPGSASAPRPLTRKEQTQLSPCGAGHASLCIDATGNVTPCIALQTSLGNVRKTGVRQIWETSALLERLRRIHVSDLSECRSCPLYRKCSRCAGIAQAETGDILAASPQACRVARILHATKDRPDCPNT